MKKYILLLLIISISCCVNAQIVKPITWSYAAKTIQPKPILKYDKVVQMQLAYFEREAVFTQRIKLNKASTT